jgi:hypothetical protein
MRSKIWPFIGLALVALAVLAMRIDWPEVPVGQRSSANSQASIVLPQRTRKQYVESQAEPVAPEQAGTPNEEVKAAILAPPNGSYDWEDDQKTLAGTFSPTVSMLSQSGNARRLSFTEDHALPTASPADVPWVAKCWPTDGGKPTIWNGSNAVSFAYCAFASKTQKPVRVEYWLVPN